MDQQAGLERFDRGYSSRIMLPPCKESRKHAYDNPLQQLLEISLLYCLDPVLQCQI